jgi:hypothetical protein
MLVKERLIQFIKYKGISKRAFCRSVGVSETYVSSMRSSIQPDKLQSIIAHFPELNPLWLMAGEGSMLRDISNQLMPPIERHELIDASSEVFKEKLLQMFLAGEIYPHATIIELNETISRLNEKVSIVEKELKDCRENCQIYQLKHGKYKSA